jgi:hypothetical protein
MSPYGWDNDYGDSDKKRRISTTLPSIPSNVESETNLFCCHANIECQEEKGVTMTIISRPVNLVDCHPEVSEPPMIYSGGVIDFFEARRRLSTEFERGKATETKLRHGQALARLKYSVEPTSPLKLTFYSLISLAALASLLVWIFCMKEFATPRTTDTDQLRLAVRDVPNQGAVTFDQAMQALSGRR